MMHQILTSLTVLLFITVTVQAQDLSNQELERIKLMTQEVSNILDKEYPKLEANKVADIISMRLVQKFKLPISPAHILDLVSYLVTERRSITVHKDYTLFANQVYDINIVGVADFYRVLTEQQLAEKELECDELREKLNRRIRALNEAIREMLDCISNYFRDYENAVTNENLNFVLEILAIPISAWVGDINEDENLWDRDQFDSFDEFPCRDEILKVRTKENRVRSMSREIARKCK